MKVQIDKEALNTAWALIFTREWPFSMMEDLARFKRAYDEAVKVEVPGGDEG